MIEICVSPLNYWSFPNNNCSFHLEQLHNIPAKAAPAFFDVAIMRFSVSLAILVFLYLLALECKKCS